MFGDMISNEKRRKKMATRARQMNVDAVPGARQNRVRAMICCGAHTRAEALAAAKVAIDDLARIKAQRAAAAAAKSKTKK
jgi:hypothetical protein